MGQGEDKKGAKWAKADVIVKGLGLILISGAITFYGYYTENKRESTQFKIAECSKRYDVFMRMMTSREAAEADMKAKMFDTLMEHYFKKEDKRIQVLFLRLIAYNFQEYLNLKPFFENLDSELPEESKEKEQLLKAAKNIVKNQVNSLVSNGGNSCEIDLQIDQEIPVQFYDNPQLELPLRLKLVDLKNNQITVSTNPKDQDGFTVTYYDMPFVDNSRLGELRYSIVLLDTNVEKHMAKIKVVAFPQHYYCVRDRLRIDKKIGDFLEETYGQE